MRLKEFKVTNYRNIRDSGWIDVGQITAFVGQNEAGKSNLFEALSGINSFIPTHTYNVDEDWPVDDWGNKDATAVVCEAKFALSSQDIAALYGAAGIPKALPATPEPPTPSPASDGEVATPSTPPQLVMPVIPEKIELIASRSYDTKAPTSFTLSAPQADLDSKKADAWIT